MSTRLNTGAGRSDASRGDSDSRFSLQRKVCLVQAESEPWQGTQGVGRSGERFPAKFAPRIFKAQNPGTTRLFPAIKSFVSPRRLTPGDSYRSTFFGRVDIRFQRKARLAVSAPHSGKVRLPSSASAAHAPRNDDSATPCPAYAPRTIPFVLSGCSASTGRQS